MPLYYIIERTNNKRIIPLKIRIKSKFFLKKGWLDISTNFSVETGLVDGFGVGGLCCFNGGIGSSSFTLFGCL
jgi:hypothetical protein